MADCAIAKLRLARTAEDTARAIKTRVATELVAKPLSHSKETKKRNYVGNQDAESKNAEYPAQRRHAARLDVIIADDREKNQQQVDSENRGDNEGDDTHMVKPHAIDEPFAHNVDAADAATSAAQ